MSIKYRKGYKYQLAQGYGISTALRPVGPIETEFIHLSIVGTLYIEAGYAWDGPSGPTIDTKSFMRGSLVHDALYQLIRMGALTQQNRKYADELLKKICLEDGMWKIRAWWVYQGVRKGAGFAAKPENRKKIYTAP